MSPALKPARSAFWFASTSAGSFANFSASQSIVGYIGRLYSQYISPSV